MPTEMELTLEQTQQGVSYEVASRAKDSSPCIILAPEGLKVGLTMGVEVDPYGFEGYVKMVVKSSIKELKKCIFNGPYVMTRVLVPTKPATEIDPPVPEHTVQETYENTLPENRAYIDAKAEAIHMILSGIGGEIYSTVDACKIAKEMWTTIERLQQGESLNKQDVKTNFSRSLESLLQEMGSQLNHTTQGSAK
ncbi:hypothetical protein Tco_0576741 [Tanacetum coccineum]